MGFLGLFVSLFGLGVVTKNYISDTIDDVRSSNRAKKNGDSTYLVNGYSERYTKTGQKCTKEYSSDGHVYIKDLKTGKTLEDITATKNSTKQQEEIKKSRDKGWVFYRKTDWDAHTGHNCNVWVSDIIPGYFHFYNDSKDYLCTVSRGELVDEEYGRYDGAKKVNAIGYKPEERYYLDGTKCSNIEYKRRQNMRLKEMAIKRGERFYSLYSDSGYYGDTLSDDVYHCKFAKDNSEYLIRTELKSQEQKILHHEGTKTVFYYEDIEGSEKFNKDGTKYID